MDVIIANEHLQETLSFAGNLGNKELVILHEKPGVVTKNKHKTALLVKNTREAQRYHCKYDYLFGLATRELIENKLVSHVFGAETMEAKDKTHRRGSGMNQVLAKLIAEKKKVYCFDLRLLLEKDQAAMLGRMQQNKRLLQKYKAKTALYSFAEEPLGLRAEKERKLFLEGTV
ncbi:hypothetical protein GF367_02850 [Candidatus Woesearchaeota archaeon]|nr:hypothetical protein [Candidatus Woesearchaeota archaeon]